MAGTNYDDIELYLEFMLQSSIDVEQGCKIIRNDTMRISKGLEKFIKGEAIPDFKALAIQLKYMASMAEQMRCMLQRERVAKEQK